jgi:hypothetical protein
MVLFSAEFNQTAAPTLEDAGKYFFCIASSIIEFDAFFYSIIIAFSNFS